MANESLKIGVCLGRHDIPNVVGYVFGTLSPEQLTNVSELEIQAAERLGELVSQFGSEDCQVDLYATGLTVALLSIINAARINGHKLTVYHYDRDSGGYYPQPIF